MVWFGDLFTIVQPGVQVNNTMDYQKIVTSLLFNFGPFWPTISVHEHQSSLSLTVWKSLQVPLFKTGYCLRLYGIYIYQKWNTTTLLSICRRVGKLLKIGLVCFLGCYYIWRKMHFSFDEYVMPEASFFTLLLPLHVISYPVSLPGC